MTEPAGLQTVDRTFVRFQGRKLSFFAGCDYFRLSTHPKVRLAARQGVDAFGLSVSASRLTTGDHPIYGTLEKRLSHFFSAESALLVPTGYLTNLIVAQALAGGFSHALLDSLAHSSLADAAGLLGCPVINFEHGNPRSVESIVGRCGPGARLLLLTDGMFSSDGSAAPLAAYLGALPRDAVVLVDDAHGAGVLGDHGRGTPEYEGVPRVRLVQTISLSKAFGSFGGAVLGSSALRRKILERSRIFLGGTPPPPAFARAAVESAQILGADKGLRSRLHGNARLVKKALAQSMAGRDPTNTSLTSPGPVVAIVPENRRQRERIRRNLLNAGVYPSFSNYPGGPVQGHFRFVISSEHSQGQLDALIGALTK